MAGDPVTGPLCPSLAEKIVDTPELEHRLAARRRSGARVVFTNGCFDLLHPGHVTYLEAARALGDLLVVGLNSDASVRRLKGPARPILSAAERATVLAGLRSVDYVVGFEEDTPLRLIEQVRPDLLVKGGDWAPEAIVGRRVVESEGGRVVVLPFVGDHSTTGIVERITAGRKAPFDARPNGGHPCAAEASGPKKGPG